MLRRTPLALVTALVLGSATACGGAATPSDAEGPRAVLRAYGAALARGDAEAARALERDSAHRGRDLEADRLRAADAASELAAVGRALVSAGEAEVRTEARIPLASGDEVLLVRDSDGGWLIDGGILAVPALTTPRDAVGALRRALERRDLPAIEEVLARRTRAAWEAEVARVLDETADLDALQIEIEGERATVRTPDGAEIELVHEAEEWRVLDVRPSPPPRPTER